MRIFIGCIIFNFILCGLVLGEPLWNQHPHFIKYRCLVIDSCVLRIRELTEDLEDPLRDQIITELRTIELNLGYDD